MTEPEIELLKKQIEIQLDEYAEALAAYATWMANWRLRAMYPPRNPPAETVGEGAE